MYIINSKFPENCEVCPCCDDYIRCGMTGDLFDHESWNERMPNCKLERASRIEKMLHGQTPEEQYRILDWLMRFYAMSFTDSRQAVIDFLGMEEEDG